MSQYTKAMQPLKRIAIAIVGGTLLALGIALLVLPGPAVLVIPAGLAILAIEFAWARRWLRSVRALWPRHARNPAAPKPKPTLRSVRRSTAFLLRRVCGALLPKRKHS